MGEVIFLLIENDGFDLQTRAFVNESDAFAAFEERVLELEAEEWFFDILTENEAVIDEWSLNVVDVEVE